MPTPNKILPKQKPKSKGGVLSKIKPLGAEKRFLKMLVYGPSGSGKTTFYATFPGPILSIVCSGGNKTGETLSIDTPENRKKISQITLEDSEEMKELIGELQSNNDYTTVVLDHVSGFQDLVLKGILGLDELPAQKSWGLASQQQYGQCTLQCKEYLRGLLNLDCHVIILGQERVFGGSEDSSAAHSDILQPTVGVSVTPSLAGWLNPACDFVVQTFKRPRMVEVESKIGNKVVTTQKRGKGVEYCLRTEPHDVFMTKFRIPKGRTLPSVIVDPTFQKLEKLIRGE